MKFTPTKIPEVILLEPRLFTDERGYFLESYQRQKFMVAGIAADFVQDNQSGSNKGVLRGLHYQICQPQGKLVRAVTGEILDVAVDLRRSSPTFGQSVAVHLSAARKNQLWIPAGFAHGFYVLSDWAEVLYKATDYYAPQCERCLLWDDPQLAIDWQIPAGTKPVLSEKDLQGLPLKQAEVFD